jgi:hypothetical protein
MSGSQISFNPMQTTGIQGGFVDQTGGYVQGTFLDDPAMRYQLEGGAVASSQTTPLWGGLPITLLTPNVNAPEKGSNIVLASTAAINGWSLFDMATAGIITPSSNVPLYPSGTSLNFGRVGSLLRVAIPVNPTVLDSLEGVSPATPLYWDPINYRLDTSSSGNFGPLPNLVIEFLSNTSKTVVYNSVTNEANWESQGSVLVCRI